MNNKCQSAEKAVNGLCAIDKDYTSRINPTVDFCCSTNLATNFHLDPDTAKILYDLNCLSCIIEPNCNDDCCTKYDIKIIGCIPFIVNAEILVFSGSGQCVIPVDSTINICSQCSICVNELACTVCNYEAAIRACAFLQLKLKSCTCVTATVNVNRSECIVYFTGTFTLPNCDPPASVNCALL